MKRVLAIILSLALMLSLTTAFAGAEKPRVAFIVKGYNDTYCYLVGSLFEKYAKETYADQYTVDMFDGEMSNETINNLIDTSVANGYDVIIFEQNDPNTPVANVKAAVAAGVKVIVTVGSVNDDGESFYLDANPVQQGSLLTTYAIEQGFVKEGTKVALLRGIDGTFHADGRHEGFITDLKAVKADIVDDQTAEWSTSKALPIVEAWLVSNPEIEVIFAANDDMALGAIQALKGANRSDIKVFSVDANELGCQALIDGDLTATVAQDTFGYANGAADYASKLLKGETVQSQRLPSKLILLKDVDEILMTVHGYTAEQVKALYNK
jgi:ABC-type sugar transport system substrate-binding protein